MAHVLGLDAIIAGLRDASQLVESDDARFIFDQDLANYAQVGISVSELKLKYQLT